MGFAAGLLNGGPVVLVWGYLLAIIGALALSASLAEMASIIPVAGAQYHASINSRRDDADANLR